MIVEPNSIQLNFLGGKATGGGRTSSVLGLIDIQLLVSSDLFAASFQTVARRIGSHIIHSRQTGLHAVGSAEGTS
jgi:hypothetical protein